MDETRCMVKSLLRLSYFYIRGRVVSARPRERHRLDVAAWSTASSTATGVWEDL